MSRSRNDRRETRMLGRCGPSIDLEPTLDELGPAADVFPAGSALNLLSPDQQRALIPTPVGSAGDGRLGAYGSPCAPGEYSMPPASDFKPYEYIVQTGDGMQSIAAQFGHAAASPTSPNGWGALRTVNADRYPIVHLNPGSLPCVLAINPGDRLRIPAEWADPAPESETWRRISRPVELLPSASVTYPRPAVHLTPESRQVGPATMQQATMQASLTMQTMPAAPIVQQCQPGMVRDPRTMRCVWAPCADPRMVRDSAGVCQPPTLLPNCIESRAYLVTTGDEIIVQPSGRTLLVRNGYAVLFDVPSYAAFDWSRLATATFPLEVNQDGNIVINGQTVVRWFRFGGFSGMTFHPWNEVLQQVPSSDGLAFVATRDFVLMPAATVDGPVTPWCKPADWPSFETPPPTEQEQIRAGIRQEVSPPQQLGPLPASGGQFSAPAEPRPPSPPVQYQTTSGGCPPCPPGQRSIAVAAGCICVVGATYASPTGECPPGMTFFVESGSGQGWCRPIQQAALPGQFLPQEPAAIPNPPAPTSCPTGEHLQAGYGCVPNEACKSGLTMVQTAPYHYECVPNPLDLPVPNQLPPQCPGGTNLFIFGFENGPPIWQCRQTVFPNYLDAQRSCQVGWHVEVTDYGSFTCAPPENLSQLPPKPNCGPTKTAVPNQHFGWECIIKPPQLCPQSQRWNTSIGGCVDVCPSGTRFNPEAGYPDSTVNPCVPWPYVGKTIDNCYVCLNTTINGGPGCTANVANKLGVSVSALMKMAGC